MDEDRIRSFAEHRTWRWREDPADADHNVGIESTDEGFRYFAWSHLDAGLTREERQRFEDFDRDGPRWPLPAGVEAQVREWLAAHRR
jgi:hypothetical protein